MPIAVDRKRGRYKYTSEESPAPPGGVATEEHVKGWISKDPQYQNDLPEQPNYSEVVGDNQLVNALAYQMNHTGRRFVRSRPGKPYGNIRRLTMTNTSVNPGETVQLPSVTGYGWVTGLLFRVDHPGFAINLYRDAKPLLEDVVVSGIYEMGFTSPTSNFAQIVRYDSKNSDYVLIWDPPEGRYYSGKIRVTFTNTDTAPHLIIIADAGVYANPR